MVGEEQKDTRIIGLSQQLKSMVQQQKFDDLLAPKAPYVGQQAVNLLKTTDLPLQDQMNFIKAGFGDALTNPAAKLHSDGFEKERLSLDIERSDSLKASVITFKFICFKTPSTGQLERMPNKLYFQLKFFTFPTIITDKVRIKAERP